MATTIWSSPRTTAARGVEPLHRGLVVAVHDQRAVRVVLRAEGEREAGAVLQAERRVEHVEAVLGAAAGAQRRDPAAAHVQRRDRLLDHLDPVPLRRFPLLRVELHRRPSVRRVTSSE